MSPKGLTIKYNNIKNKIMRHIRLISRLSMFFLCFFVSLGALAGDEVGLTVEKAYITPGQTATLTIKLKNTVVVGTVGATINLPEGLTFVKGKTSDDGSYVPVMSTTEFSKKATCVTSTTKPNVAHFSIFKSGGKNFQPGEGDLITFDVNVAENFGITGDIILDEGLGAYAEYDENENLDLKQYKIESSTTKLYNADELCFPSVADFSIAPGEKKTITLDLKDEKHLIEILSWNVKMPAGLSIDPESYEAVKDRAPLHEVVSNKSGRLSIRPNGAATKLEELDILGTSGAIVSFDVIADASFSGDATIKFYDFLATTKAIDGKVSQYYSKDFEVKVTKGGTATGINGIESDFAAKADGIYTVSGLKVNKLVKGINIVVKDGKATKVVKK